MHKYGIMHYMQSSSRDTDIKNRLVDTAGEGEGGKNWETSIKTYTLLAVCRRESSGKCLYNSGDPTWYSDNLEGWDGVRNGKEVQGDGDICILMTDSHVVWQKSKQHCKAIFLQIKKKPNTLISLRWKCSQIDLQSQQNSFQNSSFCFCINWC